MFLAVKWSILKLFQTGKMLPCRLLFLKRSSLLRCRVSVTKEKRVLQHERQVQHSQHFIFYNFCMGPLSSGWKPTYLTSVFSL